jgi:oligopeptide transport system substrate-binding protein
MFKTFRSVPALFVVLMLVVSLVPSTIALADDAEVTFVAQYRAGEEVVLDGSSSSEISSLDGAQASDVVSITYIENLFLGLTDSDPITGQINPELATEWTQSEDGLTWTFTLRTDVNWMQYDPVSGSAAVMRPVVADDFVYGIKRALDPRLGGYYGTVSAPVLKGGQTVNQTPAEQVTDELIFGDTVDVSAPDDTTLVINLEFPAAYFFSMTPMWMLRAFPREAIEEYGDDWTQPGNIWSNGPFFIQENVRGVRRIMVRNNDCPADLFSGDGNIERVMTTVIEDAGTAFALYQDNQLDSAGIPPAELQGVLADPQYADQVRQIFDLAVFYFSYGHDKPPFNDVHARRAFSAIIDRQAYVEQIRQGRGVPMIHLTPPGMLHAPPINEIGIGFDPEYARTELAAAGFPDCEGFPNINIVVDQGANTSAEFWAAAAEEYLGCDPALLNVEQLEFSVRLEVTDPDAPTDDRPNAWLAGWGPDYLDANNWVRDVLACTAENSFLRPCTEIDDLIDQASRAPTAERDELYAEIENAFFGPEGEFPIAPLYLRSSYLLYKTWYTGPFETDGLVGGAHWGAYTIDMEAKLAARG